VFSVDVGSSAATRAPATVPGVDVEDRAEAALTGGDREQLESFLHDQRVEIVNLLDGLTEEQARRRLVPSRTTLLGLVKHAAFVERVWFDVAFSGRSRAEVGIPDAADESFALAQDDTVDSVIQRYREAWEAAVRVAAEHGLDDVALHNRRGPVSLRWIYLHLIRELARHAGHGDILREQILAVGSDG
jgi:Protein of unknown function (DUF664)